MFLTCVYFALHCNLLSNWNPPPPLCGHSGLFSIQTFNSFFNCVSKSALKHKTSEFTFVRICLFHLQTKLQSASAKCFQSSFRLKQCCKLANLLGDANSSLLDGEQQIWLWWWIPLFFQCKTTKTQPNCIWMQTAASPRSQREKKTIKCFFLHFYFWPQVRRFYLLTGRLQATCELWDISRCVFILIFFSLLQRSVISPTPPPGGGGGGSAGSVPAWGLLQAVVTYCWWAR